MIFNFIFYRFRLVDGQIQEFNSLSTYMQQFSPDEFLNAMSDFHLLIFIASMDTLPLKVFDLFHINISFKATIKKKILRIPKMVSLSLIRYFENIHTLTIVIRYL